MNKSMILAEEISSDMKYLAKLHIHEPDSMATVSQVILNYSLAIKNCAIAFVPGYFKGKYEKYMPGAKRVDGKVENLCFYTEEHYDYPTKTWFLTALETGEAKLYKALDKLEAVIQHNESPLDTWLPLEYELNLTYGNDAVAFSPYLKALRAEVLANTQKKIAEEK